jgi:Holliday junction resolvase
MLESKIQTKIKKKLEAEGWLVVKLIRTSINGIPDLLALKNGKAMFIEVKQESGKVSEIQKLRIKQLQEQGFEVNIWTDYGLNYSKKH